ncbi:DUF4386 domain-containing protein [Sunxiuqinia sp. A32]|uniref:DUF4386 domain-containing protein n=1 Tax=Sunxiuqinia sp. A32 TaxID=3461496 RepID=UPI004045CA92
MNSTQKLARVAGAFFILNLMLPFINWTFILSKFVVTDNISETVNNILENELLFRVGISIELFMSIGLIVLALALYQILKATGKSLAMLALLLKLAEATLAAVAVLIPFIALQFINNDLYPTGLPPEQLQFPIGLLLNSHKAIMAVPMVFLGLDMILFCYLFFKSNFVPRIIAGFGILSFALIFVHALMYILMPELAAMQLNQFIFWTPSGIFEIAIGIWLLAKGINMPDAQLAK